MYERFFSLTKTPFPSVPDADCVLTAQHADAIGGLAFGVLQRRGYLMLTGEAGVGKTTALRALSQILSDSNVESSFVSAPTLTASEFLEFVILNFGFKEVPASKAVRLKLLEEFLVWADKHDRIAALIVDEAHLLSPELLEEIRLLGNFEHSDRKLLQIVLVGQNQLNEQLNSPQLWQLKQRIAIRLSLQPLDADAVSEYIRFRWGSAGGKEPIPFDGEALDAIARWSKGIPRMINSICDRALLIAFSETSHAVDSRMVREACDELGLPAPAGGQRPFSIAPAGGPRIPQETHPAESGYPVAAEASARPSRPSVLKRWLRSSGSREG